MVLVIFVVVVAAAVVVFVAVGVAVDGLCPWRLFVAAGGAAFGAVVVLWAGLRSVSSLVVVGVEVHVDGCCAVVELVVVDRCWFAVIPVGASVGVVVSFVVVVLVLGSVDLSVVVAVVGVGCASVTVVVGVLVLISSLVCGVLRLPEEIWGLQ